MPLLLVLEDQMIHYYDMELFCMMLSHALLQATFGKEEQEIPV